MTEVYEGMVIAGRYEICSVASEPVEIVRGVLLSDYDQPEDQNAESGLGRILVGSHGFGEDATPSEAPSNEMSRGRLLVECSMPEPRYFRTIPAEPIGSGIYGIVYRAIDRRTSETVAVKKFFNEEGGRMLPPCSVEREMFPREFNHTNIVGFVDFVQEDGEIYLMTEFLDGETLAQYLERFPDGLPLSSELRNSPIPYKSDTITSGAPHGAACLYDSQDL